MNNKGFFLINISIVVVVVIVGFGNYITRNDVSNSLNYPLINKI